MPNFCQYLKESQHFRKLGFRVDFAENLRELMESSKLRSEVTSLLRLLTHSRVTGIKTHTPNQLIACNVRGTFGRPLSGVAKP